jgi:hypothetical protein
VHSDTLYVKNRRNKSEKKKTPAATVKNPRVMRKKKSESTELTRQTWDSRHESLITT